MSQVQSLPVTQNVVGPQPLPNTNETFFRVWAPCHQSASVVFEDGRPPAKLERDEGGYFSGLIGAVRPGTTYKYQLGVGEAYPDPASRFQPNGVHGFSEVIDPQSFEWTDQKWSGAELAGQVIYEMHVGTFTETGTWHSAIEKLPYLRDTGITMLEVMPIANFPGRFGWGYDGVQLYAPASIYGRPEDLAGFVDRAHSLGLAVILDVVYNHIGPDGNYLTKYAADYFSKKYKTDWGEALNFDGRNCGPVREFFYENAAYWIRDFHIDGLRLDATQDIHDESEFHIIAQISNVSRRAAGDRSIVLIAENEPQESRLLKPIEKGGYGLDALWNDDYHHTAMVALTGKAEAYYGDYGGTPQELVSAMKYGCLYQGQWYKWQKKRRGTPLLEFPRRSFITCIQNHDQIANSVRGQRVHELSSPGVFKAITALTLLGPGTPMLFQGEEFGASSPFLFFADQKPELSKKIREGRAEFLSQWRSYQMPDVTACLPDPTSSASFERSKLNFEEVEANTSIYQLHRDLLKLRREDPIIAAQGEHGVDGAVLSSLAFLMRYFSPAFRDDRLLIVNLGADLHLDPAPEPLLAAPSQTRWEKLWSSDDARYGGCGTAALDTEENWIIPGQAAVLLYPIETQEQKKEPQGVASSE